MSNSSYLYPGKRATDRHARKLGPDEHDAHERWLQAAKDRAGPEALDTARNLVAELRSQADSVLLVHDDMKMRIGGSLEDYGKHLRSLFSAGLISKKGLVSEYNVFWLHLF